MTITYGELSSYANIERFRASHGVNGTYYTQGGSGSTYPIATNLEVGDALMFQNPRDGGSQASGMQFTIVTPVSATTFDGVWEYARRNGSDSYTGHEWIPFQNVTDNTNGFKTAGIQTVTWDTPDDWHNYMNPNGQVNWYQYNLRFRVTAVSGIINNGSISNTKFKPHGLFYTEATTYEDLYQYAIFNGFDASKNGERQYTFNIGINAKNSTSILTSKNEQILFTNGFAQNTGNGQIHFGELDSSGNGINGSSLIFEGNKGTSFASMNIIGSDSTWYDSKVRCVAQTGYIVKQGYWGAGFGNYNNQKIVDASLFGFRSYQMSNSDTIVQGLSYQGGQIEPQGAVLIGLKHIGSTYAFRGTNADGKETYVHRGVSNAYTAHSQPWYITTTQGWNENFVDYTFNGNAKVSIWMRGNGFPFHKDIWVNLLSSLLIKVIESGNPVDNTMVTIFDKNNNIVNSLISNVDGYVCETKDQISAGTASTTELLRWANVDPSAKTKKELIMTSGVETGSRSIIKSASASTTTLAEPFKTTPQAGDRFIEIPYVRFLKSQPIIDGVTNGDFSDGIDTELFPFRTSYRKYGYKSVDLISDYKTPVVSTQGFEINPFITKSEIDASNIAGVTVDGALKTITLVSNVTSNDLYDYCQWWHTRDVNKHHDEPILTADGNNYSLKSGWVLKYSGGQVSDSITLAGTIELNIVQDIVNINSTSIKITVAGVYTFDNINTTQVDNTSGGVVSVNTNRSIPSSTGTTNILDGTVNFTTPVGYDNLVEIYSTLEGAENQTVGDLLDSNGSSYSFNVASQGGLTVYVRMQKVNGVAIFSDYMIPSVAGVYHQPLILTDDNIALASILATSQSIKTKVDTLNNYDDTVEKETLVGVNLKLDEILNSTNIVQGN